MFKNIFKKKEIKLNTNTRGFIIIGLCLSFLTLFYFIGNYSRFNIIALNANNGSFKITDGLMIYTPKTNLIKIDNIDYSKGDINIQSATIELLYKSDVTKSLETIEFVGTSTLKEFLKSVTIDINNKIDYKLINNKNYNLYLNISVLTADQVRIGEEILLNQTKESNNKLLYLK